MELSRRAFLAGTAGAGLAAVAMGNKQALAEDVIAGFDETKTDIDATRKWVQFSDRKIRMGLVGYGLCQFSAQFGLQHHPNVEIAGVSDLIPERCDALSKEVRCEKKFPSLEEMLKDDSIEAIFLATDAPSHCRQCIDVLKRGKHVATAVPAMFGSLDDAMELYELVKSNPELVYTMFETTAYRDSCYAMRQLYNAGEFGKMVYTEGEYYHYFPTPLESFRGWRLGLPPQFYPTHSNGFYCCATGGSFTEVTCLGMKSVNEQYMPENNRYKNPFGTEIALFRTSEGGMARMAVSWDTPHFGGEMGRCRGQFGSYYDAFASGRDDGDVSKRVNLQKPALPEGMDAGGHGGSHGYLGNDFVEAILGKKKPLVDIRMALNLSVSGYFAHMSALKDGETMKIPQFA